MMFHVGMKVVCVDADGDGPGFVGGRWSRQEAPRNGQIYTVISAHLDDLGDLVLWLAEIRRSARSRRFWGDKVGYAAWRFRPVTERKTDIEIFRRLLVPGTKIVETV